MAAPRRAPITGQDLPGFKSVRLRGPLVEHLHTAGTARGRAGNRQLCSDQYATWLWWSFLNPLVTSLRGLQQTTMSAEVQQRFGVRATSLGARSEAAQVFDAEVLQEVLGALGQRIPKAPVVTERAALQALTAVAGSLLPALPQMTWALGQEAQHRAAKRHVAFEVLRHLPVAVTVTAGPSSERAEWRRLVQPGGFYVVDRGYTDYRVFQELHALPCHFLARLQYHAADEVHAEQPVSAAAHAAGVRRDGRIRRLGSAPHVPLLPQPVRVVRLASDKQRPAGSPQPVVLVTNHRTLAAELVALAYRYRWAVELFCRWLKCGLGCRHLLSQSPNGVRFQVYAAIIASLLLSLWIGRPPTKRTYEMLCFYLSGWATEAELQAQIDRLYFHPPPAGKT